MGRFPLFIYDAELAANAINEIASPEGIDTVAHSITENGVLVVIAAAFVLVFIAIFGVFLALNTKMTNGIMEQIKESNTNISTIMSNLVTAITNQQQVAQNMEIEPAGKTEDVKNDPDKQEQDKIEQDLINKDLLKLYIDYTFAFKTACQIALGASKADRIAIYLFHNSNKTPYGFHFIKVSCIFELTENGNVTARGRKHNSIPMHIYDDFIHELYVDKEFIYSATDSQNPDNSGIKEFISDSKVRSILIEAISREDGAIVGFVSTEYEYDVDLSEDSETYKSAHDAINNMILSISHIVTNEDFHKQYESLHSNNK